MIEEIDNNQIHDILKETLPKQTPLPNTPVNNEPDASLGIIYNSFIENAKEIPQTDPAAVQKARQLLLSGQLEAPENIIAAAENIVSFGI